MGRLALSEGPVAAQAATVIASVRLVPPLRAIGSAIRTGRKFPHGPALFARISGRKVGGTCRKRQSTLST